MMASQTRAVARGRVRAAAVVATSGLVAGMALLGAPSSQATPPGSPQCNATGGNTIAKAGSTFVHTFTASGSFVPKQGMSVTYLVVGGGGGGGGALANAAGGGGGSGAVKTGSATFTAGATYTVTVGGGGAAGAATPTAGTSGTASSLSGTGITTVTSAGGGGGGGGGVGSNGASGGGGAGTSGTGTRAGGTATDGGSAGGTGVRSNTVTNVAGGGGGGYPTLKVGGNGSAGTGGAGNTGLANSITGTSVVYGGGGGGGGGTAGAGGSTPNGGTGGSSAVAATAGAANTGGGGGGAGRSASAKTGAAGGSGVVILAYTTNAGCPSQPQTPAFSSPTFSWTAPATIPSGQTISQYTVIYKQAGDTTLGNIYARSTSGSTLSINVLGTTQGACTTNNPSGWTCNSSIALTSGQTYQFQVFARTSTAGLSKVSTAVSVAIP